MYVCVKLGSQVDKASALQSEDVGSIPVYYRFANPFSKEFNFENADNSPFKQSISNCVESTIQPGSHKEITWLHTQYITRQLSWHVSSLLTL